MRGCRSRSTATTWTSCRTPGSGQFHSAPVRVASPLAERSGLQRRVHAGPLRQQRAGYRQQHDRAGAVRSLRHRKGSRSRSRTSSSTGSSRMRPGTFRWVAAARTARTWRSGRTRCSAAGRSRRSSRRAAARTSRRSSAGSTRRARGTPGNRSTAWATVFCCAWRPDQIGDPNSGGSRDAFFNQAAYAIPAPGQLGNAKKGSLKGPGTWVVNFAFYKDVVTQGDFRLQFSALLDNAFNHPQFFPTYGSGFVDLTSFLIDGDPAQRHNRCAGCRCHRKRRRILAWTGRTLGHQSHVLVTAHLRKGHVAQRPSRVRSRNVARLCASRESGAVSAWAIRTSRLAPRKNAPCAESSRSRRRLPYSGRQPASVRPPGTSARRAANRRRRRTRRSGSVFGSPRHGAQGRPDSPRPPRPRPRDARSLGHRGANRRGNRGAAAARRVLPTFERRDTRGSRKTSRSGPPRRRRLFRHQRSSRPAAQPIPAVVTDPSQPPPAALATRRGGTFCRVAKREAGADEPRSAPRHVGRLFTSQLPPRRADIAIFTTWPPDRCRLSEGPTTFDSATRQSTVRPP